MSRNQKRAHWDEELAHILEVLEEMQEDDLSDESDDIRPAFGTDSEDGNEPTDFALADIELLLRSALMVYTYDKNREALESSLRRIGEYAASFPAGELRLALRFVSPAIDDLLAFTDVWQSLCWKEMVGTDEDPGFEIFGCLPEEDGRSRSVPFLAFLLAGTDFPFTEEELSEIRSGAGTTVGELRSNMRGKESAAQ